MRQRERPFSIQKSAMPTMFQANVVDSNKRPRVSNLRLAVGNFSGFRCNTYLPGRRKREVGLILLLDRLAPRIHLEHRG